MAFKTRQGTEAQRLLLSGTSTPASGEPLWVTDYKKYYMGDGVTVGGVWIGPGVSAGTSVVFDSITCTTLTTTGSSVYTPSLHTTGITASTLLLSSSANTKILYCTGVRANGDLSGYTLYLTGDTSGRSAYYTNDVSAVGVLSGGKIVTSSGSVGLLTATTITATTFSGITALMISGSPSTVSPYYFGWSGSSAFAFGNHLTVSNTQSTGVNPSIFLNVTGSAKWGIECDRTNNNLQVYAGAAHGGVIKFTYGDVYVHANQYVLNSLSATTLCATTIYSGGVDIATLWGSGTGGTGGTTVHSGLTGLLNNDHPQYRLTASTIPATQITTGMFAGSGVDFWFPRNVYCDSVVCKGDNVYLNSGVTQSSGGIWVITGAAAAGNGFYYVTGTSTWTAGAQFKVLGSLTATTISGSAFVSGSSDLTSLFSPIAHTHAASAITSGTFGTGAFTFPGSVSAVTYSGITGPMIHGGSAYTVSAAQLGTGTGDSMFRVSNHFFVDNSFGNYNSTIYYQNTGATKWALDLDKTTENLQMYRLGGTGLFKITAGDFYVNGNSTFNTLVVTSTTTLAAMSATSISATSVTGGTMRVGTDILIGNDLYINYDGGGASRFWMHNGTTFSGANIAFNSSQFEISHSCNFGGSYIATDGAAGGYDLYLNTNTSNTARLWFGHVGASYNAHSLSYDTGTSRFLFSGAGLTVNGAVSASSVTASSWYTNSVQGYLLNAADYSNVTGMTYASFEPTGFINTNQDSTISFSAGNRTLTIAPTGSTFDVMVNGALFQKTGGTVQIADVQGLHHIVYNSAGTLTTLGTGATYLDFMYNNAYVANVFWDKAISAATGVGDERHGTTMDPATHQYLHFTVGSRYYNGLAPNSITSTGNGDLDAHAVVGFTAGRFYDEDVSHDKLAVATGATIPVVYITGVTGQWRAAASRVHPLFTGGTGRVCWNSGTTTWSMVEASNNYYVLYHFFATNSISTGSSIIALPGQAEYTTAAAARAGANVELQSMTLAGLPSQEFVPLCTIIFQTNTTYANASKAKIVQTDTGADYIDWRKSVLPAGAAASSDHGTLTGLADDDHLQYLTEGRLTGTTHSTYSASSIYVGSYGVGASTIYFNTGSGYSPSISYFTATTSFFINGGANFANSSIFQGNLSGNNIQTPTFSAGTATIGGLSASTFSGLTITKGITIPYPLSGENITMFYTDRALTYTSAYTVVVGSSTPSVTWEIRNATARTDAGTLIHSGVTTATTIPYSGSAIASTVITANTWVFLKTTATGATTTEFHLTMKYREN